MNIIINAIAPKRRIQITKKYVPFINKDLRGAIKEMNKLMETSKNSNDPQDYTNYKNFRNSTNNRIKRVKFEYCNDIFDLKRKGDRKGEQNGNWDFFQVDPIDFSQEKIKGMWKSVKENSNTSKSKTPQSLIFNK